MWGSNPSFCISQSPLSYARCLHLWEANQRAVRRYGEVNISSSRPGRTNYAIVHDTRHGQRSFALRMYRTHILTWFEDGSIKLVDYDTGVTRRVQSTFGPLRLWSDSRLPMACKRRFGSYATHYPFESLTIDPEGYVGGLSDTYRRVRPEAKRERAALLADYRKHALPRLLLGEFNGVFARHGSQWGERGWRGYVPAAAGDRERMFELLRETGEHERVLYLMQHSTPLTKRFGRWDAWYATADAASLAVMNALAREYMADSCGGPRSDDYEDHVVEYPRIQTRELR